MSTNGNNDESPSSPSSSNFSPCTNYDPSKSVNQDIDNQSTVVSPNCTNSSTIPVRNQVYVVNQQNKNSPTFNSDPLTSQVIQNNISITNINAPLHIGPSFQSTIVHTNCSKEFSGSGDANSHENSSNKEPSRKQSLSPKEKEHIRNCWISKRVIHDDEVLAISKNIGKNWKDVGNALKFNFVKIEKWEQDAKLGSEDESVSISDAVYRMLYFWVQWKDEKATVGRLAKALYNSDEKDAIDCLEP